MSIEEYARLVERMRKVQRRFFAGERSAAVVGQAKELEREVDKVTTEIVNPGLFGRGEISC